MTVKGEKLLRAGDMLRHNRTGRIVVITAVGPYDANYAIMTSPGQGSVGISTASSSTWDYYGWIDISRVGS